MGWEWWLLGTVLFLSALFSLSLWEKHRICCHAPGQEIVEPQFGPYLSQRYAQLVECGAFNLLVHHHVRFKLIAVLGFTMDRRVLVHCGEGTLAGMRAKQTWLYSRLSGGEILVTTDSFDEGDPSGLTRPKRIIDAELPELLRVHTDRFAGCDDAVIPFSSLDASKALESIARARAERLVNMGRAQWLDLNQTTWRYTLKGGFSIIGQFFRQLAVGLLQFWRVR